MPFSIIRQDITKMDVDVIVNAANTALKMGGGVCGAIFQAAGAARLQAACDKLAPIGTGEAVLTPGFDLPARAIIHTAGPVYTDGRHREAELLADSYRNSLDLALAQGYESIAFPLISSGIYGFPKKEALTVAVETIRAFLSDHDLTVYLTVFDKEALTVSQALLGEVTSYIDEHYAAQKEQEDRRHRASQLDQSQAFRIEQLQRYEQAAPAPPRLEDRIRDLDEPFAMALLKLIDEKGLTDVQVYKRANLDRKLFSKIRTNLGYTPSKATILALCIALELDLEETDQLLRRAGFSLTHARKFDVIIEYFILQKKYDVFAINEVLFQFDQPILGM